MIVERCFSKLAIIKSRLRNKLETATLDNLLRVSIAQKQRVDNFNYNKANMRWDSQKKGRAQITISPNLIPREESKNNCIS